MLTTQTPIVLTKIRQLTERSPRLQEIVRRLKTGGANCIRVGAVPDALQALLVASLLHLQKVRRPLLLVTENGEAARTSEENLRAWLGPEEREQVLVFPDLGQDLYKSGSPPDDLEEQRFRVLKALLKQEPVVVVTSVPALMTKILTPATLRKASLSLRTGQVYERDALLTTLLQLGFERAPMVQALGLFSVRGDILDIFPYGVDYPVRLEFFGDEVESIRYFDPYSQRSRKTIEEIWLLPRRGVLVDQQTPEQVMARVMALSAGGPEARQRFQVHLLMETPWEGIATYAPFFHTDLATLIDYFPAGSFSVLSEPELLAERATGWWRQIEKSHAQALLEDRLVPLPESLYQPWDKLLEAIGEQHTVHLTRRSNLGPDYILLGARHPGRYQDALDILKQRLAALCQEGFQVFVLCSNQGQAVRTEEWLGRQGEELVFAEAALKGGFILPDAQLAVFTEVELFRHQHRRHRPAFREGVVVEDFTALQEGDYVVHIDHGIGRYVGLQRLRVDGVERDCLAIRYLEDDRIYIPIEQLSRVQKYLGKDGRPPTLHRLGGKAWDQLKSRTKKALRDMAQELIRLYAVRATKKGYAFSADTDWQANFEETFIYDETPDQLKTLADIKRDMQESTPMDRLVCGDVGYGKTEVAIRAAFKAVMDGKQVAVLVPTTILAQQHMMTFSERLVEYPIRIEMLSRFRSPKQQRYIVKQVAQGGIDIIIGTHRLLQKDLRFKDLGLVIIDEEQLFGVADKERLKKLRLTVDVLTLTATPIPRTMHMALVGARDMSIINTPPRNRLPVRTEVVRFNEQIITEAILREVERGGQVYFVHNRVQSINAVVDYLRSLLPQIRFAMAHGQMAERELEWVMVDFLEGKYDCLVSTMIIESGLDIPNVNTILINRADRFGLAQLYQLRGRVGRSHQQAYAYLLIPSSGMITDVARKRLQTIAEFTELGSGFNIAMRDLEIRGAGNILGAEQHGFMVAVGFNLYCRLLKEAIKELQEEPPEEKPEPTLQIHVDAYIPATYITDSQQKVAFYQRLAEVQELAQLAAIQAELRDRFGRAPQPVETLFDLMAVKLLAKQIGLQSVVIRSGTATIRYPAGHYPGQEQLRALIQGDRMPLTFAASGDFQIRLEMGTVGDETVLGRTKKLLQKLL